MNHHISIILYLERFGQSWAWRLNYRTPSYHQNNNSFTYPHLIPFSVSPKKIESLFYEQCHSFDYVEIRSLGINFFNDVFPKVIQNIFKDYSTGDIYFIVPPEWCSIPFEICYIPGKDFMGNIFQIGTSLILMPDKPGENTHKTIKNEHPHADKILVIADPANDLPYARIEGEWLQKITEKNNILSDILYGTGKERILFEMRDASIIHFSGHSFFSSGENGKLAGWKLKDNRSISFDEMVNIGKNSFVPYLIFSNSCYAGSCNFFSDLTGIAGAFLKAQIPFFIGPTTQVTSDDALDVSKSFYNHLFNRDNHSSPSLALLKARREIVKRKPYSVAPLFYRLFGDPLEVIPMKKSMNKKILNTIATLITDFIIILLSISLYRIILPTKIYTFYWGITNHGIDKNREVLKNEYTESVADYANQKLKNKSTVACSVKIIPGNYAEIFAALHRDEVQVGMISPFAYIYHRYLCPDSLRRLICVGVLVDDVGNRNYYSGFLVHLDSKITSLEDITKDKVQKVIFGSQRFSTSTRIIPTIYFWEHGLGYLVKTGHIFERPKMIDYIKKNGVKINVIGTLSTDSYIRKVRQNLDQGSLSILGHIPIDDIPIPYDPICVDSVHWHNNFSKKDRKIILASLSKSVKKIEKSWEDENSLFVDYVASGIIIEKCVSKQNDSADYYVVHMSPSGYDLYDMSTFLDSMHQYNLPCKASIFEFSEKTRGYINKKNIGSGYLFRSDAVSPNYAIFRVSLPKNWNLIGKHLLIDDYKKKP